MTSVFYPKFSLIQAITQGQMTTVTFTAPCDFTQGEIVSFRVSRANGMFELNNVQTRVVESTGSTIVVDIDSNNFTPFVYSSENAVQNPAMVVPSSSGVMFGTNPAQTTLADAFDNIPT